MEWRIGFGVESQRLVASAAPELLPSGVLATPTLLDIELRPGVSHATLNLDSSQIDLIYWQVISIGCTTASSGLQKAVGDVSVIQTIATSI